MANTGDYIINVSVNEKAMVDKVQALFDEETMQEIHTLFAKLIDPWVPMRSRDGMAASVIATPEYIQYPGPYAHYQYVGTVYAANLPIIQGKDGNAQVVGWYSKPGVKKHPTERRLGTPGELRAPDGTVIWTFGYTTDMHPLATSRWDKVAMQTQLKLFERGVKDILLRKLSRK